MATHHVHNQPRDALTLTPAETMAALGISRSTLHRYVEAGELVPHRLPSGHRRFSAKAVEALLARGQAWEKDK